MKLSSLFYSDSTQNPFSLKWKIHFHTGTKHMSNCHFSFFFFFFVRQTFSASRKGCLGELAASWGGRRRFAQPLSQPWTHLMLLCRGRAECCIFLFPLLCSGQRPCPGVAGRGGNGNSSAAFSWFHMAQAQLARGGWLFPEPHSPGGPHEVGVCSGTWHGAERPEADTGCSLKPPWWATSHQ